jgi:hypothetical protein
MRRMWIIAGAVAAVVAVTNAAASASAAVKPAGGGGAAVSAAVTRMIFAFAINDHGEIVGSCFSGAVSHGVVLRHGVLTTLNAPGAAQSRFTEAKGRRG